jgi:heat shock protein HtpX
MNLIEQQAANRRRTWLVLALFVGFLFFLGLGFDRVFLDLDTPVPVGAFLGLGVGSVSALAGYFGGDKAVLLSTGAVPVETALQRAASDDGRLQIRQFGNIVEEMAIAAGLPVPKAFVVPDPDPNAFATGRDPEHASIAVTEGLLQRLDREELQGVVAHEMSHVRNHDIRLMTLIAALVGGVALLADWSARSLRWGAMGGRRSRRSGSDSGSNALGLVFLVVWMVGIVLAPLVGQLLAMAVSRRREYLADASAAELTRNPGGLADALEKIEEVPGPTEAVKRGSAHLCITDPLGRRLNLREGFWADFFASHPPMARRIAALRTMAYQKAG